MMMRSRKSLIALVVLLISCVQTLSASKAVSAQKFRADEWVTECDSSPGIGAPDCSITVPFWQSRGAPRGSFALVVMLQTGNMGIVGEPFPTRAVLRIDKNPPIECREARYCVFPSMQALAALKQLKTGSLILIDVYTEKGEFNFSLTPKGFQAGMAQIRAWGYRTE
jgi:invasion protein IalB